MKSELLVCACSCSLARAGSYDSSGLSRCSRWEESLLCSLAAMESGAAREHSTVTMGLLYRRDSSAVLHGPEHSLKLGMSKKFEPQPLE